jgi:hypothetical protein
MNQEGEGEPIEAAILEK